MPQAFKFAYITPLLEKVRLDGTDAKNYRPISNLTVISKLLERVTLACCRRAVRLSKISFDGDRFGKSAVGQLTALDRGDVAALQAP